MQFAFDSGSPQLFTAIGITVVVGFLILALLLRVPPQFRRPIIATITFICGLFYVLLWLFPNAQDKGPNDVPLNFAEDISFRLQDAVGEVASMSTILTGMLLGLGAVSLLRIHITRLIKMQRDWFFSLVALAGMASMCVVGYIAWYLEKFSDKTGTVDFAAPETWNRMPVFWVQDFLFDGILQKMDAAMFSIIAFYIISAAYRAFRIRSVEATILLATALIVMLSFLPLIGQMSNQLIDSMTGGDKNHILGNLRLSEIYDFIRAGFQTPAIRGIDFGIGVGALAMGVRLWLSLDKQAAGGV